MVLPKLQDMTIKHKLIAIIMLTSIIALSLTLTAFITWEYFNAKANMVANLTTHADIIAENSKAAIAFNDKKDAGQMLSSLHAEENTVFACLYDKHGKILAEYQRWNLTKKIRPPQSLKQGYNFKDGYLSIFKYIDLDDEKIGAIYLQAELNEIYRSLLMNLAAGVIIAISVLSLAYLASSKLQKIISGPILDLAEVTKVVSDKQDYSIRATKNTNDEVGLLTNAFNKMLEQIQQRDLALVNTNEQLETRVQERTVELTKEITVRKKTEENLKASNKKLEDIVEKLNQSNQQLKEFTYIASHDLREPVRKISSFGQLLAESLKGKLEDDDRENLDFMIDGANRMQQMIEALLTYSRVTTKGIDFKKVNLNDAIEQLKTFELAVNLEETGGKILVPEQLPTVEGDPAQVRQLLQNFISNALKYQKKDMLPEIIIRAYQQDDGMTRIEVEDNGIGIKREQCENVFVMFRRLHSRQEYDGTGIGLAVCKKIVERHGGQIGVTSAYGRGSTFWFTMPAAEVNSEAVLQS